MEASSEKIEQEVTEENTSRGNGNNNSNLSCVERKNDMQRNASNFSTDDGNDEVPSTFVRNSSNQHALMNDNNGDLGFTSSPSVFESEESDSSSVIEEFILNCDDKFNQSQFFSPPWDSRKSPPPSLVNDKSETVTQTHDDDDDIENLVVY